MDGAVSSDKIIVENPGEWLSLGIIPSSSSSYKDFKTQERPKIFSCNYCMRKFHSAQALGGHQNAHRKKRSTIRHYQLQRNTTMVKTPPVLLGVCAHSLVHNPGLFKGVKVARFDGTGRGFGNAMHPNPMEEATGSIWPGHYHMDQPIDLDLNLKL